MNDVILDLEQNNAHKPETRRDRRILSAFANARGMTLVEIMIVVTIMASIMGVVGFFVFGALSQANEKEAKIEIAQLRQMVNTFYLNSDPHRLPDQLEELTQGSAPLTKKIPSDPWGNPYLYRKTGNRDFVLISIGDDGVEGTEDDIGVEKEE